MSEVAPVTIRPAGPDELDAVHAARARCYATGYSGAAAIRDDPDRLWVEAGDCLLARRGAKVVGTLTAYSGRLSVRGRPLPCQGVAWVGTAHDSRRAGGGGAAGTGTGVGTALVRRCLDLAREREQVVSALMPFRASYYEAFGYGLVERRADWQIPLTLLPRDSGGAGGGDFELIDLDDAAAVGAVAACRARQADAGHGDVALHGPLDGFAVTVEQCRREGYLFARFDPADPSRVTAFLRTVAVGRRGETLGLSVPLLGYDTPADSLAVLGFVASLRDQYRFVRLSAPIGFPLNRLLRESQLPHRGVEHAHAACELVHRMQARILDHARFFNETPWPDAAAAGRATVAVREPEGRVSRFALDVSDGRCAATASTDDPDFACDAKTWAAVALGDLRAADAAALGLADATDAVALRLLDTLASGPTPFCRVYF